MLLAGQGDDRVYGEAGNEVIYGGSTTASDAGFFGCIATTHDGPNDSDVADVVWGVADATFSNHSTNTGNDYLDGGAGDDRLYGGDGADTMIGGIGHDIYTVDDLGDIVREYEGEGTDEVYLDITLSLFSYVEYVTLTNNTEGVVGNALANRIIGNSAANYIDGAEGNDIITGGANGDRLLGRSGNDIFVYNATNEGNDRLLDFSSNDDALHFRASAFGGLPTLPFYEEDTRILRYDGDGIDSAFQPVVIATLQEGATLSHSDIFLF